MVSDVFLGIGSNIGDREHFLYEALSALENEKKNNILACSSIYETLPYGPVEQEKFLNLVVHLKTVFNPFELLIFIHEIETRLGRVRNVVWGPRKIDIDILFYTDLVIESENLSIPHKELLKRDFVLYPLVEIAPNFIHPVEKKMIKELLSSSLEKTIIEKRKNNYKIIGDLL